MGEALLMGPVPGGAEELSEWMPGMMVLCHGNARRGKQHQATFSAVATVLETF